MPQKNKSKKATLNDFAALVRLDRANWRIRHQSNGTREYVRFECMLVVMPATINLRTFKSLRERGWIEQTAVPELWQLSEAGRAVKAELVKASTSFARFAAFVGEHAGH